MRHVILFHSLAFILGIHQVFAATSPTKIIDKSDTSSPKQGDHFVPPVLTSARRTKSGRIPYSEWDERTKAEDNYNRKVANFHRRVEHHMKKSDIEDDKERRLHAAKKARGELKEQEARHKRFKAANNVVKKTNSIGTSTTL